VICGLPASGKSTLAAALGELTGARVVQSDKIRQFLAKQTGRKSGSTVFGKGLYVAEIKIKFTPRGSTQPVWNYPYGDR
jgi:predicted kinase